MTASLILFDPLAIAMSILIVLVGMIVALFSWRYLAGDAQRGIFFARLALLLSSLLTLVLSNHLLITLVMWGMSNTLLVLLMIHKRAWRQAVYAGRLAASVFCIGWISLALAFWLLYQETHTVSIQDVILLVDTQHWEVKAATMLLLITALTQSAIWPFHRWLLSSLNSPTPVSAVMHAGLVNGGGFLLVRFSEIFLSQSYFLNGLFILGAISALLGGLWKLCQQDIKRMLACSTMSQMGFMLMQCGLGLFPLAMSHLFWHGLFKANLFLNANTSVFENRRTQNTEITASEFGLSALIAVVAVMCCAKGMRINDWHANAIWIVLGFIWITITQLSLALLKQFGHFSCLTLLISSAIAYLYGTAYFLIELYFSPMHIFKPQPLNVCYITVFLIFTVLWVLVLFRAQWQSSRLLQSWWPRAYMAMLNASQPHADTITTRRQHYQY